MSRDTEDLFDRMDDLSVEEIQYFYDRPWLIQEYEIQTGESFPHDLPEESDEDDEDEADEDGSSTDDVKPYDEWDYEDLVKEVSSRNADRSDDSKIKPDSRSKDALINALKADDEAGTE